MTKAEFADLSKEDRKAYLESCEEVMLDARIMGNLNEAREIQSEIELLRRMPLTMRNTMNFDW